MPDTNSSTFVNLNVRENVPLAPLTTLEVGGPARFFVRAECVDDVRRAFAFARQRSLRAFVLGGGSNILVSDKGFDGLVIQVATKGVTASGETLNVAAGEDWDAFVALCVDDDLAGIECLSGIPGSVGGTPVQNVGAYGQEVSETIASVRCYDRRTDSIVDLANEQCGFSYRRSIFNTSERDRYVVLSVTYALNKGGEPKIAYKDLIETLGSRGSTLRDVRNTVLRIRRSKSMVIDPLDPNRRSAGSFFKNPVVTRQKRDEIGERYAVPLPSYPQPDGMVKIPAAWLIEHSGFRKGFSVGKAGISSSHTLAIVNHGGATAAEIVSLKDAIQNAVSYRFGIDLVPEPIFVGEF